MKEQLNYDVIIVGAGIVGLTLALALARQALKIAVLDVKAPTFDTSMTSFDHRVSAITETSQRIFTALKCWSAMCDLRVSPYQRMCVWDANGSGEIAFDSESVGQSALGHIVENSVMQRVLWEEVHRHADLHVICPRVLTNLMLNEHHATVSLQDGRQLTSQLIVGADGHNSWVRQQAGIAIAEKAYGQQALVATVQTELPHQLTAWQRFLTTGTLAFLPLVESHTSSIVWSTSPEEAEKLMQLDDVAFCKTLAHHFDQRLGHITAAGPRYSFPLKMQHAKQYVQAHCALVGDAAHTLHPLAGQGLNLGLLDAACLADVIFEAHAKQQPIGSFSVLRRYERWRKGHNVSVIGMVSGFQRLFMSQHAPISWARNIGLNVLNRLTPLKKQIIRYAAGKMGELPRWID